MAAFIKSAAILSYHFGIGAYADFFLADFDDSPITASSNRTVYFADR